MRESVLKERSVGLPDQWSELDVEHGGDLGARQRCDRFIEIGFRLAQPTEFDHRGLEIGRVGAGP